MFQKGLFVVLLLVCPVGTAFAIPPPELITTTIQSILASLGMIVAFLATAFYFLRDLLSVVWRQHKKHIIAASCSILSVALILGWLYSKYHINDNDGHFGQMVSMRKLSEHDDFMHTYKWKEKIFLSMYADLHDFFDQRGKAAPRVVTLPSFSPRNAQAALARHDYILLDAREPYEQSLFGVLANDIIQTRYGDIANGNLKNIPTDKKIIVICYSGIRGYFVALLLKYYGVNDVAFVRGGLSAWQREGLPIYGSSDYTYLMRDPDYKKFTAAELMHSTALKLDFSRADLFQPQQFPNLHNFVYEFASMDAVVAQVTGLPDAGVVLLCRTESSCFDATNFAYLLRQHGKRIIGYYDDFASRADEYKDLSVRWREFWQKNDAS